MLKPVLLPALSPGMTEGKVSRWLKKEGDPVRKGEVIAEIETDKSVLDIESLDAGKLAKILVAEGADAIAVNTPIALLDEGEAETSFSADSPPAESALTLSSHSRVMDAPPPVEFAHSSPHRLSASPRAKRMAADSRISLNEISGSGPRGRIVKADVLSALGVAARESNYTTVPHSCARKVIGKRMVQAKASIPHFYLTIDCGVDELLRLREQLNDSAAAPGKISINDLIIRAAALALREVPRVNATWAEEAILLHHDVDVAVAVSTSDGLITPIIRKADTKGVVSIATEMRQLAEKARTQRLRPDEFQGGGFCISNLGAHGIRQFTAIINPPHAAILAVGKAEARAIVANGELAMATLMSCTLSCDHRVIDGVVGAAFLNSFQGLLSQPTRLISPA